MRSMQRLRQTQRWLRGLHGDIRLARAQVMQWKHRVRFRQGFLAGRFGQ